MSYPIIALWSHPRSMSTAFERIMRARGDLDCLHEPFMYDYYINRSTKKMPHFDALDEHPKSYDAIRAMILEKAENGPVFFKDMSYYVVPHIFADQAFMDRVTHSFLIRDPKASLVSYAKLDPDLLLEEVGLAAQWLQARHLMAQTAKPPIVVESEKVQADPQGQMRTYWQAVGLADKPAALDWNEPAPTDWQQVQAWHQDVMSSKTIRPISAEQVAETQKAFDKLVASAPRFAQFYAHHLPFYGKLKQYAL